ncbi:MAG TPA: SBBP repeat-containing protein [Candidatus Acidoferrales bacterium]|nr:SBBP repeat-containing protein [Candidatus Acidoferrales bacterium]
MGRTTFLAIGLIAAVIFLPLPQSDTKANGQMNAGMTRPTKLQTSPVVKAQAPVMLDPGKTMLVFEPNQGQFASNVEWIAKGTGFAIGIGADGATIETHEASAIPMLDAGLPSKSIWGGPTAAGVVPKRGRLAAPAIITAAIKMRLANANGWRLEGASPTGGVSNYYIGKDPAKWRTGVPNFAQAKAKGVYNGIDLVFHGSQSALEYDFVVAPGANPKQIAMQFDGAANVHAENGALVMSTSTGKELRHAQPRIYQEAGGKQKSVKGGFRVGANGRATFEIGDYDRTKPLVIDPTISFARFLGGSNTDQMMGIAIDPNGFSYVTGYTYSNNFPVYIGVQGYKGGMDAFVTRLDAAGNIAGSTYLGGSGDDYGASVAVDAGGIYVAGGTSSDDFPLQQPIQNSLRGDGNVFVTKLSLLGNVMVYSTYFGGTAYDNATGMGVDATQAVYVTGETASKDFPILGAGAYEDLPPGLSGADNIQTGFVFKLSPSGKTLVYSTYLGGSGGDFPSGITLDSTNSAYVTGYTCSPNFPYAGFQSQSWPGGCNAFVTKFSPAGDAVIFSTQLGNGFSYGRGIALDGAGNIHLAGNVYNFAGKDTTSKLFAAELAITGKLKYFKTFNGSTGNSAGDAVAVDAAGDTWVGGGTSSSDFPGAPVLAPNPSAGLVMKLDPSGNGPIYTVLLGAGVDGLAVQVPRRIGPAPTYPQIYACGVRFSGGTAAQDEDTFVVKLSEAPSIVLGGNN